MDEKISIHEPTSVIALTKEMRRKLSDLPHYFRQIVQDGKLATTNPLPWRKGSLER